MKRSFFKLGAGLILLSLGVSATGCSQTGEKSATTSKKKPVDPTSWSESDGNPTSRPASNSRMKGGWSSDAQDIEKSLGVNN